MSKSVLIIGNGFDKNCGLKTSYSNVYEKYKCSPSESEVISEFKASISKDKENWSDFELGMANYAKSLESEDVFIECLDDFNSFMHNYLISVQHDFYDEWNKLSNHTNAIECFEKSVKTLGLGISHNIDDMLNSRGAMHIKNTDFISLNYTEVFDNFLETTFELSNPRKPIHVHGLLGDDPILGMDRIEQLDVSFDITDRLQRHFIKPYFNSIFDKSRIEKAKSVIEEADFIFVYGASMGLSDLSWRELLVNWLQANKTHHLFVYLHRNANNKFKTKSEELDYEIMEKHNLISYWNHNITELPLEQLHLPCGKNLFNIQEAIKKEIADKTKKKPIIIN